MGENKTSNLSSSDYIHNMHKFGRRISIITIIYMIAMPVVAAIYFKSMPSIVTIITAVIPLLAIFIPTNIAEVIAYTPIAGSSIYLSFITGNLSNLKLPAASEALKLMDISLGTEESDIFSGIAIGASTFITVAIIALGVVLMIPLQPVLAIPTVKTATSYILPALFGTLIVNLMSPSLGGGTRSPQKLLGAVLPTIVLSAIAAVDHFVWKIDIMSKYQGVIVIALLIALYFNTKRLYNSGKIKVYLRGEDIPSK